MLILAGTTIVSAVVSSMALLQANRTHILINSRMDQLIELTRKRARLEGIEEEKLRAAGEHVAG